MRTWIIGSGAECDLVVARPTVSGRHCRLTETSDGYLLEDLGSSNGTYVNGVRITSAMRISAADAITLGLTVLMPWPAVAGAPGVTVLRIGRDADNDIVLDDPRVSGHHARLLVVPGSKTLIEDLGSSNGTFLNSLERRATQAVPLTESDVVYFGSLAIPAPRLLTSRTAAERVVSLPVAAKPVPPPIPLPPPIPEPKPITPPAGVRLRTAPQQAPAGDLWTILVLIQAPVLGILIVLIFGRPAGAAIDAASWPSVAQGVASTTFALALAAVWLGGSLAAWASVAGRSPTRRQGSIEARLFASPGARWARLGVLCLAECAVLLALVHFGTGLRGSWLTMLALLVTASVVGLLLGRVVSSVIRTPATAIAVLLLSFLAMIALGGRIWPLTALSPVVRPVAAAMPSRWAFEGLLLLESGRRPPPREPAGLGSKPRRDPDLAEDFFPAESQRMGPQADATALGCMLLGLAAAAAFISRSSKSSP